MTGLLWPALPSSFLWCCPFYCHSKTKYVSCQPQSPLMSKYVCSRFLWPVLCGTSSLKSYLPLWCPGSYVSSAGERCQLTWQPYWSLLCLSGIDCSWYYSVQVKSQPCDWVDGTWLPSLCGVTILLCWSLCGRRSLHLAMLLPRKRKWFTSLMFFCLMMMIGPCCHPGTIALVFLQLNHRPYLVPLLAVMS